MIDKASAIGAEKKTKQNFENYTTFPSVDYSAMVA